MAEQISSAGKTTTSGGMGRWPATLALMLSLAAVGGSAYLWHRQTQFLTDQTEQMTDLKRQLRALDEHPSVIELKQRILEQDTRITASVAEQQAKIDALQQAFEVVRTAVNRDQRGWVLAEVEYLMRLANVRLQLAYDINGATQALITADQRLNDLADPAALQIRKVLAGEITALKVLGNPDVEGTILELFGISNRLHLLPMAKQPAVERTGPDTSAAPVEAEPEFWTQAWERIKSLIGLRHSNVPRTAGAIQAELYYVEQLLRFELDGARQALLRLNKVEFDRRVAAARILLDEHYDRNHEQVIRLRAELAALQEARLFPALPDITGSLVELRKLTVRYSPPAIP
jgi:uroporphyrin-3 C-methyltransferase